MILISDNVRYFNNFWKKLRIKIKTFVIIYHKKCNKSVGLFNVIYWLKEIELNKKNSYP